MVPALWISKTGLDAQQTHIGVITNNLANVNTVGFKRGRAVFQDLLYENVKQPGADSSQTTQQSSGLMMGTGVKTVATQKQFNEGNMLDTKNPLDMAVNGRGFFQVLQPDGTQAYTRDGKFQLDSSGQLVTSNGYALQPAITIPQGAQSVTIGVDGVVSVMQSGSTSPTQVGTIQLADFVNPAGLQPIGENLYKETGSSSSPTTGAPGSSGMGSLLQGSLESSNVNVVEELVNLIEAQRAYEMNSKAIGTVDSMLQYVSQQL